VPQDTISAIATPLGEGGIGIIRISGPGSLGIAQKIIKFPPNKAIKDHEICHAWVVDNSKDIDEVLVTYMGSKHSYTGEDVIEINCHGGVAVLRNILELTIKNGARLAQKGEFTKRAFLNGRIDLAKAEAVIDIIKAKTKEASIFAASQLKGALSNRINKERKALMDALAEIEASIDFPDEIDEVPLKKIKGIIARTMNSLDEIISTADLGKIFREGVSIAIIGKPNVGKSSIMNALLRSERAIVTEEPGTTRDTIEEPANIMGIPLRIIDTAGIRKGMNKPEKMGVKRAKDQIKEADLIILVIDISGKLSHEDMELIKTTGKENRIITLNKADKKRYINTEDIRKATSTSEKPVIISALTGNGIKSLEEQVFRKITSNKVLARNQEIMINLRQKQCLERAKESLGKCMESITNKMSPDFIAIDLREGIGALGEVTGDVVSDQVIESIFERFCVGK